MHGYILALVRIKNKCSRTKPALFATSEYFTRTPLIFRQAGFALVCRTCALHRALLQGKNTKVKVFRHRCQRKSSTKMKKDQKRVNIYGQNQCTISTSIIKGLFFKCIKLCLCNNPAKKYVFFASAVNNLLKNAVNITSNNYYIYVLMLDLIYRVSMLCSILCQQSESGIGIPTELDFTGYFCEVYKGDAFVKI